MFLSLVIFLIPSYTSSDINILKNIVWFIFFIFLLIFEVDFLQREYIWVFLKKFQSVSPSLNQCI